MNLVQFIRLFLRHAMWIIVIAGSLAAFVFNATKDEKRTYSTEGLVNTGLVSGYNIESQGGGKTDYFYTSAELDNILNLISAYETNEELGTHLLAEVMMHAEPPANVILPANLQELRLDIGGNLWDSLSVEGDHQKTMDNLIAYRELRGENNPIHDILYSKHPIFGIETLTGVKVVREGKSDMIRLSYTTVDPGICQRTVVVLIDIFRRKHREIKESQTANVLDYFEAATDASAKRLRESEERMKRFQEESRIINYYEQTRFIANKREDLFESYLNQVMNLVAADSAIKTVERQLNQRNILGLVNQDLMTKRDSLSAVVTKIAQMDLLEDDTFLAQSFVDSLRSVAQGLRTQIVDRTDTIQRIQRTPRGTEIEMLLNTWLENLLKMEDAAARLQVIEKRKEEFEEIYDAFAPLGSTLKRLEREINVAEREYLENLHSLNMARLHKQNMLMATNLKVVDVPFFPTAPDPSSRMMLVIVAFLAGFILPLAVVIAMEYFDKTLKKPGWAARMTELEIIGILPRLGQKKRYRRRVKEEFLEERPIGLLLQHLKIELSRRNAKKPVRILILSTRDSEGKTMVGYLLAKYLRSFRANVAFLTPEDGHDEANFPELIGAQIGHENTYRYYLEDDLFEMETEENLLRDRVSELPDTDYFITELPGLLSHPYPVEIVRKADLVLLTARANRTWIDADKHTLERISSIAKAPVRLILNGVDVEYLEQSMGDLPKKRSLVRRYTKRLLKSGFSSRSKL